ncbi:MAG: DUF2378 family protein [Myxococcota bacterium]
MQPLVVGKSATALHSMFEGLFVRALKVDGPFKERLRAKGFDLDRPQLRYPVTVWEDCIDVAVAELYPGVPRDEGWRRIGRRFIEGYFETLVGRMLSVTLPLLSSTAFLNRGPRMISTGLEGARVRLQWRDPRTAVLHVEEASDLSGALVAGALEVCFERMRKPMPQFTWTSAPGASTLIIALPG